MSFEDYRGAWPKAQQTERSTPEQIRGARAACEDYVRRKADGDIDVLREYIDMLGLGRTVAEIAAEQEAVAASPAAVEEPPQLETEYRWAQDALDAATKAQQEAEAS